jgi:uncharacterized phage protein (TIGR02218 family)
MSAAELFAHLAGGQTTVCRAWLVTRRDGVVLGFTDHDRNLNFEGVTFKADSGLTARAVQQTTGLAVDNSEALGALSDAAVTEKDLLSGRYDAAEVRAWLVNWAKPEERIEQFRGTLGEITRAAGAFRAELRGLTEALNQPQGRVFQRGCSAVLGDAQCRFDLSQAGYFTVRAIETVTERTIFGFASFGGFEDRWFERGRLIVTTGEAKGAIGLIKNDRTRGAGREIELWQSIGPTLATGDLVRLEAGCDKAADTCRVKFANFLNFRGFPHIPGEDWLTSYPKSERTQQGQSLFKFSGAGLGT